MDDTFYCHACGKHKKVEVRVRPMQCASCNEKAKKYIANPIAKQPLLDSTIIYHIALSHKR